MPAPVLSGKLTPMTRTYLILAVCLIVVFGTAIVSARRPDPDLLRFEASGAVAYGYGTTTDRSVGQMSKFIRRNPDVETLVFRAMPGTKDTRANITIARKIRRAGLATHLERDSIIASGAVDLFIAGTTRTMECGARIGVHSWGSPMGYSAQDVKWDTHKGLHESFLRDMGVDPAFYSFTRNAAPPEGIYWMTPADIARFGLLTEAPNCTQ